MTSPVLTRDAIARAALEMIDTEGWAAFSLPRLSESLGIRTPSLYHHFRDRSDLLSEVARTVVLETPLPPLGEDDPWWAYFLDLAVGFRRTLLRHPETAAVLLQHLPREVMTPLYEAAAVILAERSDLPLGLHITVLDALEKLTLGAALVESRSTLPRDGTFAHLDPDLHPQLVAASEASSLDGEEMFAAVVRSFLAGLGEISPAAAPRR